MVGTSTTEGRGGEKGGSANFRNKAHRTFDPRNNSTTVLVQMRTHVAHCLNCRHLLDSPWSDTSYSHHALSHRPATAQGTEAADVYEGRSQSPPLLSAVRAKRAAQAQWEAAQKQQGGFPLQGRSAFSNLPVGKPEAGLRLTHFAAPYSVNSSAFLQPALCIA